MVKVLLVSSSMEILHNKNNTWRIHGCRAWCYSLRKCAFPDSSSSAVWNLVSRVWLSDHFPVVSFSSWMSHDAWFCCTVILVMSSVLQFCLLIFSTFSSFSLFCFFLPLSALCDGACYERLLFFFTAGISFTSCLSVFPWLFSPVLITLCLFVFVLVQAGSLNSYIFPF